ncbi:hypothetical protein ACH4M4_32380 [Streptomyces sp. NPDC017254]|uniref:hypothetical protein n=1 Tax=unclassified Streptomyces TaxID=2593676 RepID=UPI0037884B5C
MTVTDLPWATAPTVQRRATLPLAGRRPLTPSLPGAANPPGAAGASETVRTSGSPAPDSAAGGHRPAAPLATSGTPAVPAAVPLFKPTAAAPSPSPSPAPAVQRASAAVTGATAPPLGSPRPDVPVVAIAPPSTARPVARPVAVQRRSAPEAAPAATPAPAVPVVTPTPLQRSSAAPVPIAHAPRAATVTRTAPAATSVQRADGQAPAAPPSAGSESPTQLDELARRLVTPLSRLLRAELRADRERVGRLRDHGR